MARPAKIIDPDADNQPGFTDDEGNPLQMIPLLNDEPPDDVTALTTVLAELGASSDEGGFVNVYREVKVGAKREDEFIDRFEVNDFSLLMLKNTYGAGRYKISVYRGGDRPGLATRKVITIADTVKPVATLAAPALDTDKLLAGFAQIVATSNAELGKLIVAGRPAESSRREMLEEMMLMRQMFDRPEPASPQMNFMEAMKFGVEMAQMNGGEGGSAVWITKMIDKFGEPIAHAVMNSMQSAQAEPRVHRGKPSVAVPLPHTGAPAPIAPLNNDEDDMNLMVKMYLRQVNRAAAENADVEMWADNILGMMTPDQVSDIEAMMRSPDWSVKLAELSPESAQHPVWYGRLRDTLLAFIEEDRNQLPGTGLTEPSVSANLPGNDHPDTPT